VTCDASSRHAIHPTVEHIEIGLELKKRRERAGRIEAAVDTSWAIVAEARGVEVVDRAFERERLIALEAQLALGQYRAARRRPE